MKNAIPTYLVLDQYPLSNLIKYVVLEIEHGLQKTEKEREKMAIGPGPKECGAGNETSNCGESCALDGDG